MNRRLVAVFAFALVVSGIASLIVYRLLLANVAQASTRKLPRNKLLVASHDLQVGAMIEATDLRVIESASALPQQAINDAKEALGRGVIAPIYENEPIKTSRLAAAGAGAGMAAMIPVGKRAVALRVNEVVGLAGFVVPGMRVDVIVAGSNMPNGQSGGDMISRTILQNIEVLSAGQKYEKRADGKPEEAQVVNLLVTPDQAETLSLAGSETKVQLVLRNPLDTKEEQTKGTTLMAVLGRPAVAAPAAPKAVRRAEPKAAPQPQEPETVEVVYGGGKRKDQILDGPAPSKTVNATNSQGAVSQ